jgi:hypothetical protein
VTGRAWQRVALVALVFVHVDLAQQILDWVPGEWGVVAAFLVPAFFLVFWLLVPLREHPRCRFRFPIVIPDAKNTHQVHHCTRDLGHVSASHECRCGLGYTRLTAASW